jgi:hypothetical protein
MKIKLKGCHFDKIEMIETESQAVLNTLTEHDFQDAFRKWQKRRERCIRAERDYFRWQTSPGNYAWLFAYNQP